MPTFFAVQVVPRSSTLPVAPTARASTGIAVSWSSPIGPLKFSYGHALNAKKDVPVCDDAGINCLTFSDKIERFQFQLGTVF